MTNETMLILKELGHINYDLLAIIFLIAFSIGWNLKK